MKELLMRWERRGEGGPMLRKLLPIAIFITWMWGGGVRTLDAVDLIGRWECVDPGSVRWRNVATPGWDGEIFGGKVRQVAPGRFAVQLAQADFVEVPLRRSMWSKGPWTLMLWLNAAREQYTRYPRVLSLGRAYLLHLTNRPPFVIASNVLLMGKEGKVRLFQAASPNNVEPGRWYHVAVVVESTCQRLYVDGRLVRRVATQGLPLIDAEVMRIGSSDPEEENGFNGLIGPVALYNGALDDTDILAVYTREASLWKRAKGLAQPKQVTNFAFVLVRSGAMEFGLSRAGGFVRSVRWAPQPALIEYVSLREGDKSQITLQGSQWKVDWAGRSLELIEGHSVRYTGGPPEPGWELPPWMRGTPLLLAEPAQNRVRVLARGKLVNLWRQTVTYERIGQVERIAWDWKRTQSQNRAPMEATIQFMRWVHNFEVPIVAIRKGGGARRIGLDWETLALGDELVLNMWRWGRRIRLTVGSPCDVRRTPIRHFVGGWGIVLRPHNAESLDELRIDMQFEPMPNISVANLDVVVHPANGAMWIEAGGMPLVGVEAFESDARQSLAGLTRKDAWDVRVTNSPHASTLVTAHGRLRSQVRFRVERTTDGLSFQWQRPADAQQVWGAHLILPYEWVGARVTLVEPDGTSKDTHHGVPLRIGADMDLGEQPAGSQLIVHLTGTEQLIIRFDAQFRLVSYRKQPMRTAPFRTLIPFHYGYPSEVTDANVFELRPPAGLVFIARRSNSRIGLSLSYRRRAEPRFAVKASSTAGASATVKPVLKVKRDKPAKGDITVVSPWWRVAHYKRCGGAIAEIVFPEGTGRNILIAPIASYLCVDGRRYVHNRDRSATLRVVSATAHDVVLEATGMLRPEQQAKMNRHIRFRCVYHYTPWWLKRTVEFHIGSSAVKVTRVGVLELNARPELDQMGDKPCVIRWQKAVFPGPTLLVSNRILPSGVLLFQRGVEGIDFMPNSDLRAWRSQIVGRPDTAYVAVEGNPQGGPRLVVEALRTNTPVHVHGTLRYTHYLGLPCVRKYLPRVYRPCYLGHNRWGTTLLLRRLAEHGVNVAIVGFGEGGFGYFVPSDRQFCKTVRDFIRSAHACGIRVVPFTAPNFPLKRLPPKCKQYFDEWVQRGKKLEPVAGPTWFYFCYEAPAFRAYLQKGFSRMLREFAFDGLYCDGFYPMGPCYNDSHGPVPHACWDGLVKFARWMRESLLGSSKLLWAHTGYYPSFIIDNLCDMTWVFEEVNFWCNKEGRVCSLDRIAEMAEVVPNTQRVLDITPINGWMTYRGEGVDGLHWDTRHVRAYMARLALCGLFSIATSCKGGARSADDLLARLSGHLQLARVFRDFDLSKFQFADWRAQSVAIADSPAVRCAVYWNQKEALIVVANPESLDHVQCRVRVLPDRLGWSDAPRFILRQLPDREASMVSHNFLVHQGVKVRLKGFDYCVLHLRPVQTGR